MHKREHWKGLSLCMVEKVALCWVGWSKTVLNLLLCSWIRFGFKSLFHYGLRFTQRFTNGSSNPSWFANPCPSPLMAGLVCLTVAAWLPYPRKHGFSINLDEPLVVIAAQSNVIQREGHELMFFGPDSPRLSDRSRLVFKSNSGGNQNERSGVFLSPSSHNWLSCFRTWQWWGCTFFTATQPTLWSGEMPAFIVPMIFWFIGSWKG